MEKDLKKYAELLKDYTELRFQENRSSRIVFVNGNLLANSVAGEKGASARVRRNGSWGFASTPSWDKKAVEEIIKAASDNASFLDSRLRKNLAPLPSSKFTSNKSFFTNKKKLTQKERVDFCAEINAHISKTYKNLKSVRLVANTLEMEKSFINSDGTCAYSMIPRSVMIVSLAVERDGSPVELYDVFGKRGQFEDVFERPSDLFKNIDELYSHLMKKAEGVFPESGSKECVLDANLAGILAHEAIGHTTEADIVQAGSVAGHLLNKSVASPLVNLVDFANTAFGKTCPVPVYADDEGTKARDAVIIEEGVLRSFMHNKESALRFGVEPTGNARAYAFSDEPIIRMRNTAILPGKSKLQDMLSSIKDGYYLMKPSNGQADSTSEFMFGIVQGYEIKNGKLARGIKDTTISGVAYDVLKTVSMVSDDMNWSCGGMCGKKQLIPVGMGGPAIKCRINIGGK